MQNPIFAVLILTLFTACASKTPRAPEKPQTPLPVIDVHTHTRFNGEIDSSSGQRVTRENYMRERAEAGVVASISHVGETGGGFNADMKAQNVFHCFGIGDKVDLAKLERGLKSRDYRCVKIYLGYFFKYAYEEPYRGVYRLAEKYDIPVVFHTGDTLDHDGKLKYADPLTIDEVAVDFPKVTFVIAHLGNPWFQSAAEVAYKNPNVYVEGSALLIGDFATMDPAKIEKYLTEPLRWALGYMETADKLLYGTDWPYVHMKPYLEAYKRAIPRDQWCKVFFDNAVKVFRLKEVAAQVTCTP